MHGLWEQHMCTWETVKETCHQWRFPTAADVEEMWSCCHFSWHINQLWRDRMAFFHGPTLMLAIFLWELKNKKQNWIACSDGQVIQLIGVCVIVYAKFVATMRTPIIEWHIQVFHEQASMYEAHLQPKKIKKGIRKTKVFVAHNRIKYPYLTNIWRNFEFPDSMEQDIKPQ